MANVLGDEKKQQVLALGRLGWPLRRIEMATGIRWETASAYLKAAGIGVRAPGGWGRRAPKAANEVSTDSVLLDGIERTGSRFRACMIGCVSACASTCRRSHVSAGAGQRGVRQAADQRLKCGTIGQRRYGNMVLTRSSYFFFFRSAFAYVGPVVA